MDEAVEQVIKDEVGYKQMAGNVAIVEQRAGYIAVDKRWLERPGS